MYADVSLIAAALCWGAAVGSLAPRAVYRLSVEPDEAWRDRCPAGHPFTGPARGWLGLTRCAPCAPPRAPVRAQAGPPAVTAVACGVLAAATGVRPELAVWLLLAPAALLLALVDIRVRRLPDQLTLPLAALTVALLGGAWALPGSAGSWPTALLGGAALGAGYLALFLIHPNGLGFGDVKLALPLGTVLGWYGWGVLLTGAFAGFLLGSLYGVGLMLARRADRKTAIPFGPFMIAGAWAGVVLGAASS
ncbi:prepilin peptidase [Streptomyces sp. NPDC057638]|uniref:prepilin peptidase n=1 Tax=Streptomyces sp. NPDC057638 TaxID=3346190 RepID=UPI0036A42E63